MNGLAIKAEQGFHVGQPSFLESRSPDGEHAIAFEDDGSTGYLYVLDPTQIDNPILDVVYLYDCSTVSYRNQPCNAQIAWSTDGVKAALLINWFPHVVVDFQRGRAWCRSGRALPDSPWSDRSRRVG